MNDTIFCISCYKEIEQPDPFEVPLGWHRVIAYGHHIFICPKCWEEVYDRNDRT